MLRDYDRLHRKGDAVVGATTAREALVGMFGAAYRAHAHPLPLIQADASFEAVVFAVSEGRKGCAGAAAVLSISATATKLPRA